VTEFSIDVFQNEFVPDGTTTMDAIVTVTAHGGGAPSTAGRAAEVLVIDTSGSMGSPPARIHAARQAAAEAIDVIRDGVEFAVVSGTERATMVFPTWGAGLVVADPATRQAAKDAVRHVRPSGGTAMSTWLRAAGALFSASDAALRHVILLTDGENTEEAGLLEAALAEVAGQFQVDCRGVGTDWIVSELRTIAHALYGTVDIIPEPHQMAAVFTSLMASSMSRSVAAAELRVWCPKGASVQLVQQVAPAVEDLTHRAVPVDARTVGFPLGAWGAESRDYHVSLTMPANDVGVEMMVGRVGLVSDGGVVGPELVRAIWTDDEVASARINREVAHYTGQAELAASIQAGLEALKVGDDHEATVRLGRATQLASGSGHDGTVRLLRRVVDVDDERTGTVRIRKNVAKVDEMALDTRSTRTVRVRRSAPADEDVALEPRSTRTVRVGAPQPPADGTNGT
jgi:hypothetical protein